MEVPLVEVCVASVDWLGELGEVCDGEVADGCCDALPGLLGLVCATSHTLDSSRIDAIRYTFLI